MNKALNRFWVRKTDVERLLGATNICYLFGGYDGSGNYGDILQLESNTRRLSTVGDRVLIVPLVERRFLQDHEGLCIKYPQLFSGACFVSYFLSGDPELEEIDVSNENDLIELVYPPAANSQILIFGGGFFNDFWGERKLSVLEALEGWLSGGTETSIPSADIPIMTVGQQIAPEFISGRDSARFLRLLSRAAAIGVRDVVSFQAIEGQCYSGVLAKLFLSGDDAGTYLLANEGKHGAGTHGGFLLSSNAPSRPYSVNVHFSQQKYATEKPDRLFQTALTLVQDLRKLCSGEVVVNLITAYEDRKISETRYLEAFKRQIAPEVGSVNIIQLMDDAVNGFPTFSAADLTIAGSYHVALTSLRFGIPTILLRANDYYAHKHEGLRQQFNIPDQLLFDVEKDDYDELRCCLEKLVFDSSFRAFISYLVARGTTGFAMQTMRTSLLLYDWLISSHVRDVEAKYRNVIERFIQSMEGSVYDQAGEEQSVDAYAILYRQLQKQYLGLQSQYLGLQKQHLELQKQHLELQNQYRELLEKAKQAENKQAALRYQIADRIYGFSAGNGVTRGAGELLAHSLWRIIK